VFLSMRNVQRLGDNLFIFKDVEKRYNNDFKIRQIAPPRYVDWYDFERMNIVNCSKNIGWNDVVSINYIFC